MNKQAPAPKAARPLEAAAEPQRVSWSGGEKPSEIFTAAYIPADRWNGWAKPYFSQAECQRLAATQAAFNDSTRFEYDADRQVWQEFNEEEGYRSDCGTVLIDGVACHQIGSGFTWMELPEDEEQETDETPSPKLNASGVRKPGNTSGGLKGRSSARAGRLLASADVDVPTVPWTGDVASRLGTTGMV